MFLYKGSHCSGNNFDSGQSKRKVCSYIRGAIVVETTLTVVRARGKCVLK